MNCPDTGVWRAWLDEETAIPGPEEHLAVCGDCAAMVAELRTTADLTRRRNGQAVVATGERGADAGGAGTQPIAPARLEGGGCGCGRGGADGDTYGAGVGRDAPCAVPRRAV